MGAGYFYFDVFMLNQQQLDKLKQIVALACDKAMVYYQKNLQISCKSDDTPVTEADIAISQFLEAALPSIIDIPVLSEESNNSTDYLNWQRYWLIDPIDGTKGFIKKDDEFCICVALIDNHQSVFGLISAPVTGQTWYGTKGLGCYSYNHCQNIKPYKILPHKTFPEPITLITKSPHYTPEYQKLVDSTLGDYQKITHGSALKLMKIVEGEAQLHLKMGKTGEWDTAAAQIILEEQGGGLTDLAGKPLRYGTKADLTNPRFIAYLNLKPSIIDNLLKKVQSQHLM